MIFNKLIQKIEQRMNKLKKDVDFYGQIPTHTRYNDEEFYEYIRLDSQLSLLKTLQKEVEEVIDKIMEDGEYGRDDEEFILIEHIKYRLENVGVKDG